MRRSWYQVCSPAIITTLVTPGLCMLTGLGAPRIYKAPTPLPSPERPVSVLFDQVTLSDYCNEDAARSTHQYLPLLAAIAATNPTYNLSEIDIVIIRDMLRQLYTFASGRFYSKYTGFDISFDLIGNTLFVSRESTDPLERVHGRHPDHSKATVLISSNEPLDFYLALRILLPVPASNA